MVEVDIETLNELKEKVNEAKTQLAIIRNELDNLMREIKERFGVEDLDLVEELKQKKIEERAKLIGEVEKIYNKTKELFNLE